jgi:hypothetical protein
MAKKIHVLTLFKWAERSLREDAIRNQLNHAVDRSLSGGRGRVWSAGKPKVEREEANGGYRYTATVNFWREGRSVTPDVEAKQFDRIRDIAKRATGGRGWAMNGDAEKVERTPKADQGPASYAEVKVNLDPSGGYFSHLYDLDPQIGVVLSAVEEYERSQFENRFHTVLYGEPACGKTEILRGLSRMVGPDAVMHFDATSTTSAGAKQLLTEAAQVPPILCIEEIEKADETSLRWLLGVLDYRAEVRALKYRAGLVSKQVKLLCLATVNDFALFNKMMDGALASRFSNKVYCPRPSVATLTMILEREVKKAGGNTKWIKPALEWCMKEEKTNDPRRIITVCLCGRDKLLSGDYQKMLKATRPTT